MTKVQPAAARFATSKSPRSPSTSSTFGCAGTFSRRPLEKSSAMRTRSPRAINRSTMWEPMKPAPPVTRYNDKSDGSFACPTAPRAGLLGPPCFRQSRKNLQGVLIVELLQHHVRQVHAVELPE